MRTKALLLAGALGLAGIATSMAQSNVYSINVVGYINLTLTNGFNMVANQLDLDGTGTANTLYTSIGTNVPNQTKVFVFNGTTFVSATFIAGSGTWIGNTAAANAALNPGGGVLIQIPASAPYPQTVTLVGNVLQGALSQTINPAYQLASSKVPQAGLMVTDLGYTPANQDKVYPWNVNAQNYGTASTYLSGSGTWIGAGQPNLSVGQSVFLLGHAGSAWTRNFTVQ